MSIAYRFALLGVALVLAGCGDDTDEAAPTTAPAETQTTPGCRDVAQPKPRAQGTLKAPTEILSADHFYLVTFRTSCGNFTVRLDQSASPTATSSFVALADADFFDGTYFHRIVPGFVIQGGDPTGTGTGGPGYATVDTPAARTVYAEGAVAMAKTAAEPRGTAGSQFFVVTASASGLPPDYAIIGHVIRGLRVVKLIGTLGDPNTELPTQPVVITDVVIRRLPMLPPLGNDIATVPDSDG